MNRIQGNVIDIGAVMSNRLQKQAQWHETWASFRYEILQNRSRVAPVVVDNAMLYSHMLEKREDVPVPHVWFIAPSCISFKWLDHITHRTLGYVTKVEVCFYRSRIELSWENHPGHWTQEKFPYRR